MIDLTAMRLRLLPLVLVIAVSGCAGGDDTAPEGANDTDTFSDASVGTSSTNYAIVDTNQSKCYDSVTGNEAVCTGAGHDADYNGTQASYTVSDKGTMVADNVTGLIWMQSPDTNGDGALDINDKMLLSEAETWCSSLDRGGYTWRLPSTKELYSLMQFDGVDPSGYSGTDTSGLTAFMEQSVFDVGFGDTDNDERLIDGQYAASTIYTSPEGTLYGAGTVFGVNFVDGRIKGYPYEGKDLYVLCVAGNASYGTNDFTDNGNGTVSDNATGLMWEQDDHASTGWANAVATCEGLSLAGRTDWRLPNVKELHSIVDYTRSPDGDGTAAIDPVFNATSFTNEGGETDWGYYWSSTTHANYLGFGDSAAYVAFGRALGYFEQTLGQSDMGVVDVHGAGAQRSDDKVDVSDEGTAADLGYGTFSYHGPQGDILRLDNRVRCITDIDAS